MGWILDIAIVGIIGIIGYYILVSSMNIQSTALTPQPTSTDTNAHVVDPNSPTPLTDKKYGLALRDVCDARGDDTGEVKCECQKEGDLTFGSCDMPEGIKCFVDPGSKAATKKNLKAVGLDDCELNATRDELEAALGGTPQSTDEDEESNYARSYYSSFYTIPPFTMRRSDGLNIVEPRDSYARRGGFFS